MRSSLGRRRPAMVALFLVVASLLAPRVALAQSSEIKLVLRPVNQTGSWFDLKMRPGETRRLEVEISNAGDAPLSVRTYASNVYTIINGGFGGSLRGEAQIGTTRWLDYSTDVLSVRAGNDVRRSFTVSVPADAEPGEFITSLVVENDEPIRGDGTVVLDQIVRQAVAVVVTVPGQRSPALAIGEATHKVVAGTSIVAVAVQNTGNVRLKPLVAFTLFDAAGAQVSQASVQMDTFYAHTDTFVEVPLAALLLPGTYRVRLSLGDAAQGTEAEDRAITLVVAAPIEADGDTGAGAVPGASVNQATGDGQMSIPVWSVVLVAGLLLGGLAAGIVVLILRRRRGPGLLPR